MANYKVGDEVVCIDAKRLFSGTVQELVLGQKYVVLGIRNGPCCNKLEIDVGIKPMARKVRCVCGVISPADGYKYAWRFIKLDGLKDEETERTEAPIRENA